MSERLTKSSKEYSFKGNSLAKLFAEKRFFCRLGIWTDCLLTVDKLQKTVICQMFSYFNLVFYLCALHKNDSYIYLFNAFYLFEDELVGTKCY